MVYVDAPKREPAGTPPAGFPSARTCDGSGDHTGHCCVIAGNVCPFLEHVAGVPRCSLFPYWGRLRELAEWRAAPVGEWFADHHPGADCSDWPQNLPDVMARGRGLCCYSRGAA